MRTDARAVGAAVAAVFTAVALATTAAVGAQRGPARTAELARQIESRFSVLPIADGIVLTPRSPVDGVRSIELSRGTLSIDGVVVTGAELRERLGADADPVLQLWYATPAEQQAIASAPASSAPPLPAPAPPASPAPPRRSNNRNFDFGSGRRSSGDDIVHIGRDVRVEEGDVVNGDAVAIGGSATILGEVHGDVVALGGDLELGPRASVEKDVVVVGGRLHRDPGSRVGGEVHEVSWNAAINTPWRQSWGGWSFGRPLALIAQVTRIGVLCLLAMLVVLVGGTFVERIGQRAAAEPLKAGAVGFLAQLLFIPLLVVTIVLLVVTIVGIPLLVLVPFAVLGLILVALVGFTAVAHRVGRIVAARFAWTGMGPYLLTATGVFTLLIPVLLARLIALGGFPLSFLSFLLACIGWIVEYVAWTVGFGAVALTRFSKTSASAGASST